MQRKRQAAEKRPLLLVSGRGNPVEVRMSRGIEFPHGVTVQELLADARIFDLCREDETKNTTTWEELYNGNSARCIEM